MAGQIARALAVFCVDEVIIFDDGQSKSRNNVHDEDPYTGYADPNYFLMHILSYLETPPNLRKLLFPMHPDLRTAGTLPSLDMPHHLRAHEWCKYREGVTVEVSQTGLSEENGKKNKKRKDASDSARAATLVDAGLAHRISVPASIPPNTRVTLKFPYEIEPPNFQDRELAAAVVAPSAPRREAGYYWGYNVRSASSISNVFTESPFDGGYDLTFGTSERGVPISTLNHLNADKPSIPEFNHMLLLFGGVAGLEVAVKADKELKSMGVSEPEGLFDYWVNLCPGQGSRTIRTEEAIWLGLMGLREIVVDRGIR